MEGRRGSEGRDCWRRRRSCKRSVGIFLLTYFCRDTMLDVGFGLLILMVGTGCRVCVVFSLVIILTMRWKCWIPFGNMFL